MDDIEDRFETDILKTAYRYWRDLCGDRPMPLRREIDPLRLHRLLPHLFLYDVVHQPGGRLDFTVRLVGTRISEAHGGDHRGQSLSVVHAGQWPRIAADYHDVVRQCRPHYARRVGFAIAKDHVTYERVLLPISDDGTRVDGIFGAAHYWIG
ncbi:PAS domain-containing protein [Tistrella bauzanensis]|uniref:PAS domain-containing protein n=1 Tax=Tistrella TaxID=171436 RepID=UPI0031F6E958